MPTAAAQHSYTGLNGIGALLMLASHLASAQGAPLPRIRPVTPNAGDWPSYNRTLAGDRFSPLADITPSNVARLAHVCTYTLPEVTSLQTGPVVVAGVMYFTTDTISYAIDAATCTEKWRQVRHSETPGGLAVHRGFAYSNGRLFRGTSDAHVLAMDTADGHTVWDLVIDAKGPGVSIPMAPIAGNGLVFVGNAGGDNAGVTGHVYALDAGDGHVVWKFDVVPANGVAPATWTDSALPITGGAFWTSFTLDASRGILYVPAGNPAPDFDIGRRTGANLYANSVIALDVATGHLLAYNQLVKDDSHDWDVDSPPTLLTTSSGRPVVASANKDGQLAVLDRSKVSRDSLRTGDPAAALPVLYRRPTTTRTNVECTALARPRRAVLSGHHRRVRMERRGLQPRNEHDLRRRRRLVLPRPTGARERPSAADGKNMVRREQPRQDVRSTR